MSKHYAEQFGLFPEDKFKNKYIDVPWKKSQTDRMLDLYFSGKHPDNIAQILERNPKAVKRRLEQFTYNEDGRAERYEPFRRESRKGMRFTENERILIEAHRKRNVPVEATAEVLARSVKELSLEGPKRVVDGKQVAPTLDLVLAYRYAFYTYKVKIVPNDTYDEMKAEEIEYGAGAAVLKGDPKDCPHYIKTLALYLVEKYEKTPPGEKK